MSEQTYLVPMSDVERFWPSLRPGIKRALERDHIGSIDRVEWAVAMGQARLWLVYEAPFGDTLGYGVTFCEAGYCNVWAYVGDLKRFHLYPDLEDYARREGCHTIRTVGPLAWQRVLGPEWKVTAYVIERKICPKGIATPSTTKNGMQIIGQTPNGECAAKRK